MLTAVGLGPGDAELLTLKAVRLLQEADTVFVPGGIAYDLVKPYCENIVTLDFPMTRDEAEISRCMEENAEKILPAAKNGSAVFGLIGDPNYYSTFSRLAEAVRRLDSSVVVETIPGISSITAVASHAKIPVNGAFLVTDGPAEPATKIVMKVTRPQEKKAELEAEGYTDFTVVELITVKGLRYLQEAEVLIYAGSLVNPALVEQCPASVKLNSWGMSLEEICSAVEEGVRAGKKVVRLHSGDPAIYGSIVEQMDILEKKGIFADIIPGVSSMFGAAAALRTEYTPRGVSESVIITRSAGATLGKDQIAELSAFGTTMVLFLSTAEIDSVMQKLSRPKDTPVAVIYHVSWPDEKIIRGTIDTIAEKVHAEGIERSALIIVGDAVLGTAAPYKNSELYR